MNKILRMLLKSPTREKGAGIGFLKNRFLPFFFLLTAFSGFQQNLLAQTTTITTAGTGFDAANGLSGSCFITFAVENTNTYDVILTGVDNFWKTGNTGTVPSLWYTSTALSGAIPSPGISTPTWTNIMTGTALTVTANGFMPSFTNLSFIIPAGAQYRFALVSTAGISYSGSGAGTPNPNTFTTAGVILKVHDAKIAGSDVGYSGAFPTSTNSPRSFTGQIHFQPATPCVAPPTGGQATSTVATVCPNTSFNLGLTGASGGMGMTYQWQSSANGTTGWTNVTGLTNANVTTTQTTTTWYRAVLTCSGQTANSLPVQVITNATPVSGTFTINKGGMPSATNFTSIAAAFASIECGGANGPIVFNVVAGSGPYNEQIVVPVIPGTSATNTVTFNGNGNTISANPSGSNLGIITLNGADFVKFDNLTLNLDAAATAGWGVQVMNDANNNTITNTTMNLPLTSTSSVFNGIGFGTTITTIGNNGSNNLFSNNTINGGYYAVRVNGATGGVGAVNNQFINNTITDNYIYNFYLQHNNGTIIEGNNISRPTRSSVSSYYGVFMTGENRSLKVRKNRFHNGFGGASGSTGAAYVLYSSSTDAPVGSENVFSNNLIYNMNTNGTIYAIYNIGSDGAYYFHNTFELTHPTNTGTVRGFYQTTAASNIKFQNNIVSVRGPSGTKHAIYLGTTTSAITSNNNVLHAAGSASVGSWGTANQATIADWRTASSQDANSVSADPMFAALAAGNLQPTSGAVNNIGAAVTPPVTDDITGAPRSATTPDPGAYEFTPAANDVGVTAITSPNSGCGLTSSESIVITIQNFGTAPQSNIPLSYTINGGPAVNQTFAGPLAPGQSATVTFTTPANLATPNTYTLVARTNLSGDALPVNDASTKIVTAIPSISTLPYTEGFENGNGGWIAGGTGSSWALGTPAKTVIMGAATGTNAWVTNLTGQYNASENSFVQGPCFNFSGMPDPDFEMKAWWNSEFSWDGAVLQSSINGGATWQNVGAFGDPNNWYNDNTINGAPGGQPAATAEGWTGRNSTNNGSGGWVTVKRKLTGLGGQSSVQLRIAFGADGSVHDDGFAFDDIRIGDNSGNLAVNAFVPLTQLCGFGTNEKVEVVLENLGSTPVSGYTLSYTVNDGTTTTGPFAAPSVPTLAPGTPTNFIFPVGANLSAAGTYTIVVTVNNPNDPDPSNNSITYNIANATFPGLPPIFNFETATTGINAVRTVTNPKSLITEGAAASLPLFGQPATSSKGMIMEGTTATGWLMPVGITDPWVNNPDHFSAAYICFAPQGSTNPNAPLWLSFDLKQLYKTANANTNFRVTVNGTAVGGNTIGAPANTYRPPFSGVGGTTEWTKIYIDLSAFKNLSNLQVALESSVAEPFANGAGTANLIDNIRFQRVDPTGVKENALSRSLNVYPNPSTGVFSVSLPNGKAFEMEVSDLTGKVIKTLTGKGNTQLDLKGQAQGVYMLKLTSEGNTAIQKLIIQ